MHPLDPLFRPASLAIVGASADPNKVGGRPLAFLRKAGWRGRLLPVNPGADEVQGVRAFRSLASIDEPIEQAIVAVPAAQVIETAGDCIRHGVKALQVFSSGFGEGPAAAQAQRELLDMARHEGVRILGPNSLGLFNTRDDFFGTFATALDGAWPRSGPVGVATQSGAFGSYFFGLAQRRGLGFSHFAATGNELDIDIADCIDFLVQDEATRVIVIAMEGCRNGRKLAAALEAARRAGKPVLAMKVGVSQAGAQAAATHTGSLSGEDRVFDAVLRDTGAWRAGSLQALVDAAYAATIGPRPGGRRLLVITTSGGIGVLSADAADAAGLTLPPISEAALRAIRSIAPLADGRNPVDTSAGILGDLSAYARIASAAVDDVPCDAVLCYLAHIARNPAHWDSLREPLLALRARHPGKAFCAVLLADDAITADLERHGFAVFADPSHAVRSLAALAQRQAPGALVAPAADEPLRLAGDLTTEAGARTALRALGIRFAEERHVDGADQAIAAAREIGWPVVLKIVSPDIAHKTEAGGVQLGIGDEAALRTAVSTMRERVRVHAPEARIDGFLVARELRGGIEILVGSQRDPVFGPVVTVGAGGTEAELWQDVCVRLAPVDTGMARRMLDATRAGALLRGWRGAPAAERGRVAAIDLNPVLAMAEGACALDALVVTRADRAAHGAFP